MISSRSHLTIAVVAAVLTLVTSIVVASATATAATTSSNRYQDFVPAPTMLAGVQSQAAADAVSSPACSKPLAQRSGGWSCIVAGTQQLRPAATAAAAAGFCTVEGCYWPIDSTHLEWDSAQFSYGIGKTYIGSGNAYIKWTLSGTKMTENPVRINSLSTSTTHTIFSGALSNGTKGKANGGSILHTCPSQPKLGAAASFTQRLWPNSGCALQDSTSFDHNMVAEMSWELPNHTGYWYIYTRSVVAHAPKKGAGYTFDPANYLPGNAEVSGYHA